MNTMDTLSAALRRKPGAKLTPARGVSTAAAALLALGVVAVSHHISLASMAIVGVLLVSLCDSGGATRARIQAMGSATLAGALLFALGRTIGDPWWLAVPAILVATLAAGIFVVYGPAATAAGLILDVVFAVGLGMGGGPATALPSLVGFLIGGACALLAALAFSPARGSQDGPSAPHRSGPASTRGSTRGPALAQLTLRSSLVRFAVIRAGGVAVAAGVAWWLNVSHPHWAVLTVILCVRPDMQASLLATIERLSGTIMGAIVAELGIVLIPNQLVLAALAVALMAFAFTVRDISNPLFIFFLTVMTLFLISIPTGGFSLARLEVCETLIGAAVALTVAYLGARTAGTTSVPTASTATSAPA
jgi:Fusaric acid resistance protein-like